MEDYIMHIIHIDKDSWHYGLWSGTYFFNNTRPCGTNRCYYISRITLMSIPVLLGSIMILALFGIFLVCVNVFLVLTGIGIYDSEDMMRFPPVTIGTRRIPMPAVALSLHGLLAVAAVVYFYPWYGAGGLAVLALFYVIVNGFRRVWRWDGLLLFKEYLKAKKQEICRPITFDYIDCPVAAEIDEPKPA